MEGQFYLKSEAQIEQSIAEGRENGSMSVPDDWRTKGGEFVFSCAHFTNRWTVEPASEAGWYREGFVR